MIGLDTNVLVRYLAQDDDIQSPIATALIDALTAEHKGFVSVVVLVETVWVLSRAYQTPRAQVGDAIETLLRARELMIEDAEVAYLALGVYRGTQVDFADALIAFSGKRAGCRETVTFDKAAAAHAGMRLLSK